MTATVTPALRVAIEGFSEFERAALTSVFRLAVHRTPAYQQVQGLKGCDLIVVDADQPATLAAVAAAGRFDDAVFVGAHAPPGAIAWLPRPIDPVRVLRELDALLERRGSRRLAAAPVEVDLLLEDIGVRAPSLHTATDDWAGEGGAERDVLVVDDSAIARKFLTQRLLRYRYRVHVAADGEQALAMAAERAFTVVFLDIGLGGDGRIDGLRVCQQLKQQPLAVVGRAPAVIMVTGEAGATGRVRGSLAGCDAYLTKPLIESDFLSALHAVDPLFDWQPVPAHA